MTTAYDAFEQRVRDRAYEIWVREGKPDGRADQHWALARAEVTIEENIETTLEPNPLVEPPPEAEPIVAVDGMADIPGRLTDQGELPAYPAPKPRKAARNGGV